MKNPLISDLNKKDVDHFVTKKGLLLRKLFNNNFRRILSMFDNTNIIQMNQGENLSDDEYYETLEDEYIDLSEYNLKAKKHNIIVERYPELEKDEPYIFVCNHTCPEDIETALNVIDRNSLLILGSIESLQTNPEIFLLWLLNGVIPFDIMDKEERTQLPQKMEKTLETNSILIFPEGSHNLSPNKLINNLYDGVTNLALKTGRKIVVVSLLRDEENNATYMDFSNPIDVKKLDIDTSKYYPKEQNKEKAYVKSITSYIRDKMSTGVYFLSKRHFKQLKRESYDDIEETIRKKKVDDAFEKLKWDKDVFDAEYLTKKTKEEQEYESVNETINNLILNSRYYPIFKKQILSDNTSYVVKRKDDLRKNVPNYMREELRKRKSKQLIKK